MKGGTAITSLLKQEGTEYLFCFPANPIIDAAAEVGIKPIMTRTERTAVGMADAYSRVTNGRKIGVCAFQTGPGIENAFGGVAQAYSDSTPILVLPNTEQLSRHGVAPLFDAVANYRHITKWAEMINQVDRVPEFMRRAYTYLRTGRPGPVLLEVPRDVISGEIDGERVRYKPVRSPRSMGNPEIVREAVKSMVDAKTPIIHAGLGVLYAEAWDELRELAELLQAPVMTTLPGKSAFPEDHPLSLGCGGRSGTLPVARFLKEADLLLGVGASLTNWIFAAPIPGGKTAVQVTVDERDINKDYEIDYPIVGDAKLVLRQMIEEAVRLLGPEGRRGDERTARAVRTIRDEFMAEWMPLLTSDEVPINPYRVIWDLQHTVDPRNTIATHDAGTPRDQTAPFWPALAPNSYIGWGKSTHLGYGLPLAMGAKLASPQKTVLNIMGDAAIGMSGMDIETAVRNGIGTLTVIVNNSCLGGYEKHLPTATRKYRTRFLSGEYAKVASGLGAYAEQVLEPSEIVPAIRRALDVTLDGRPAVLEVLTKEENRTPIYW